MQARVIGIRALQTLLLIVVITLAALACELVATETEIGRCTAPEAPYKCIHNLSSRGFTCVGIPGANVPALYACLENGGVPRIVDGTLEDLNAKVARSNDPTCSAKTRCERDD